MTPTPLTSSTTQGAFAMLHIEDVIKHEIESRGRATAGDIAAAIGERTDVIESRLEALRRSGIVEYQISNGRVVWCFSD